MLVENPFGEVALLRREVHHDDRGELAELYQVAAEGPLAGRVFAQANVTSSHADVLRGLHYQLASPQGKLVTVITGEIYDVVVDVRRSSPTYRRWFGARITAANGLQMWCPPGFAHGFVSIEPSIVVYHMTARYEPADQHAIRWDDPLLAIAWPIARPRVSARDAAAPVLSEAELPR